MQVLEAIRMKRAVRSFRQEPLPEAAIRSIVNAGRRAQSSKNTQPWRYIVVQNRNRLEELSQCGTYASHLAGAALAVVILTPDPQQRWSIMFDAGQAASYMQLAAWAEGIGSCPATFYEPERVREILGFPHEWHTRVALSFGYPEDPEVLSRTPQIGGRMAFEDLVLFESWN